MAGVIVIEDYDGGQLSRWTSGAKALRPASPKAEPDIDLVCRQLLERVRAESPSLVVLSADWKPFVGACRFDQYGVTLLKHLRLGLSPEPDDNETLPRTHAIVCSWEPLDELIRTKPGNAILLSDGVTFLRLPEAVEVLMDSTFLQARATVLAPASRSYWRPYFAGDYRPPPSMHEVSNWWGVYQIWRSRQKAELTQLANLKLPQPVEHQIQKLNNKEALLLFGEDTPEVSDSERGSMYLGEGQFFTSHPKLVLIDDDANVGWADVLRSVMSFVPPGEMHRYVQVPSVAGELDETWVTKNVLQTNPDVVLLDLRLRGSAEADTPVSNTSGGKVLKAIRKLDIGLPVILMTASNKYWTYREMLKLGADGYWMKEGLGEHRPPVSAAEHYGELLRLILECTGPGYCDLRRLSRAFNRLKAQPHVWWQKKTWPAPVGSATHNDRQLKALQKTAVARLKVETQFENALAGFRSYIQAHLAGTWFVAHRNIAAAEGEELRALGLAGGKVIEEVHSFEHFFTVGLKATAGYIGGIEGQSYRNDYLGQALYAFRNRCAHASNQPPTFAQVRDYLALVLAYLEVKPIENYSPRAGLETNLLENPALLEKFSDLRGSNEIEPKLRSLK